METHLERTGGTNIRSFTPTPPTPEACQAECAKGGGLSMVTQPAGSNNVCTLKSTPGTRTARAGAYSGLRGLEFMNAR